MVLSFLKYSSAGRTDILCISTAGCSLMFLSQGQRLENESNQKGKKNH